MFNNDYELGRVSREQELFAAQTMPALMRKVFLWMTLAHVITGVTSFMVASSPVLFALVVNPTSILVLAVAVFALVVMVSARIHKISLQTATLLFVLYSVLMGAFLSVIFLAYTLSSITSVFFITAGTFAAMATVGYTTKKDLTGMGQILLMALFGLIIAIVVNMFIGSSMLDFIISCVGVIVFVGLTAYDTQKIKQMLLLAPDTGETMQKLALLGALTLYLDFVNLFLYLLRIFGKGRD